MQKIVFKNESKAVIEKSIYEDLNHFGTIKLIKICNYKKEDQLEDLDPFDLIDICLNKKMIHRRIKQHLISFKLLKFINIKN